MTWDRQEFKTGKTQVIKKKDKFDVLRCKAFVFGR